MSKTYNKIVLALGKLIMAIHLLRKFNPRRKKIVLIDKSDGLGDILMWMPYAKRFRERYPAEKYRLNILVYHMNKELIDIFDFFDHVKVIPSYKNAVQWFFFRILFWLQNPVDILIAFHYSFSDLLLPYEPEETISFQHSKVVTRRKGKKRIVLPADDLSIGERFPLMLKRIGASPYPDRFDYRDLIIPLPDISLGDHYIVIAPGSNSPVRRWEPVKFGSLINKLLTIYNSKIVLVGSRNEKDICKKITDAIPDKSSIIDISGKTTIRQLFGVIAKSDFLVSNETGTAHIGGVLGIKTFIIAGGGDYGDFVPYSPDKGEGKKVFSIFREDDHCFRCMWQKKECNIDSKPAPCIADITVENVLNKILMQMNDSTASNSMESL